MSFFSSAALRSIIANPDGMDSLYSRTRAAFLAELPAAYKQLPEDYIKLAFSALVANELKPYGTSTAHTLSGLLHASSLDCDNYANLTVQLYELLDPTGLSNVAMVGWNGSPLANHAQLIISAAGYNSLVVDPTIAVFAPTPSFSALTAGVPIASSNIVDLYSRDEITSFKDFYVNALEGGSYGGQNVIYYISNPQDYDWNHFASSQFPTPQSEVISNNYWKDGAQSAAGGTGTSSGVPHGFFSTTDLNRIIAHPDQIDDVYARLSASFKSHLGSGFSSLSSDAIKLAFVSVLAYELRPFGPSSATSLSGLLSSSTLDSDGYALLAWQLFRLLDPNPSGKVTMLGWNGEEVGNHVDLMFSASGARSLIVNPSVGLLTIADDFNSLVQGTPIPSSDMTSFYHRSDLNFVNSTIMSSFADGDYRTGNLLYWFENLSQFQALAGSSANWLTPQSEWLGHTDLTGADIVMNYIPPVSLPAPASYTRTVDGTPHNDYLVGGSQADHLIGGAGNDTLSGGTGADFMEGGSGNDTYFVNSQGDRVVDTGGYDTVRSTITYVMPASIEKLYLLGTADISGVGNDANNFIFGNSGDNRLFGGGGNDSLYGGSGNDLLNGGAGVDRMVGGGGNDTYVVDNGKDVIVDTAGVDTVYTTISMTLPWRVENLTLLPTATNGLGNYLNNTIIGNDAANIIRGFGGHDTLVGGGGNDILDGGIGNDTLEGDLGADQLYGRIGVESFVFKTVADSTPAWQGRDTVYDFVSGVDHIDLSAIDANIGTSSHDAFTYIGGNVSFTAPGQVRWIAATQGVLVQANVDGNLNPDFAIWIKSASALALNDFILT